jgi:hypothetical protein
VPVSILIALQDNEEEVKEDKKKPESHCKLTGLLGDDFWKNFQGNAHQWRDHAKNWADHLLGQQGKAKLTIVSKPQFVIKGNKNETVMVPIEFKNVGTCQIPLGSFIGIKNREAQLTNFIVDDVPLNS